jgi:hypothetical protein
MSEPSLSSESSFKVQVMSKRFFYAVALCCAVVGLSSVLGCQDTVARSWQEAPTQPVSFQSKDVEQSSAHVDQAHDHAGHGSGEGIKAPLENHLHCPLAFVGVHLQKDKPQNAVNAYHFCAKLNDELTQCILYDGKGPKARLIGIEYLVPEHVYEAMPDEEKKYWHHHRYEIDDQLLKSLTQSGDEEKATLAVVRTLYGKIFHTWVDGDKYPKGPAKLFYAVYGEEPFVLPEGFQLPEEIRAMRHKE